MSRIERLSVQGFRAFGQTPATLDFEAPISIIWGPNSEGKTSLAEAVEFLLTGDIARRELLSSAVDEFENALRNAHMPEGKETYVEASIRNTDGEAHTLRRTLLEDFSKRKVCTSRLELNGSDIDALELANIGIELADPPLAAPVLMQHTLGYLFSANPKERATYFKSILEVTDLDNVRESLRSIINDIQAPLPTVRKMVLSSMHALPIASENLAVLLSGTLTIAEIESVISAAVKKLLNDAGVSSASTLTDQLSQVEKIAAAKQAETFPLHGFTHKVHAVEWRAPVESVWSAIDDYKAKLEGIDQDTQRMTALFQEVLRLPSVVGSTEAIACPVCEMPGSLSQERIQVIRNHVKDTESVCNAELKAKSALGTLKASAESLNTIVQTACPDFINWNRSRRISEGFRTGRLAPLLDETTHPFIRQWFISTAHLMRMQHKVRARVSKAITTISSFQADVTTLRNNMPIRAEFELLEASIKEFEIAVEAYRKAMELLIKPLQDAVVVKSDTTSWVNLVTLGRKASELESELREAAAHASLATELEHACKQVESAKEAVMEDKFDDLTEDVRAWWNRLRPDEPAFFSDLGLRKKTQRTIDFKAGLAPSSDQKNAKLRNAIAVFSQSQMHCLGLATFFARTCKGGGFIVLDDPIITIDDDYSVHFFTAVLQELNERGVQVIMLTYDQKTWREIQNRYDNGRSEAFQLNLNNPTDGTIILKSGDTLSTMLKTCDPFTNSSLLEPRKECCQKIRDCAERLCKELIVKYRHKEGDNTAMLSDYTGNQGTLGHLIPLVVPYLASDEPGKLHAIRANTSPGNHDDDVPPKASLKTYLGDLKLLKKKYLS